MVQKVLHLSRKIDLNDIDSFELGLQLFGAAIGLVFGISTATFIIYFLLTHI